MNTVPSVLSVDNSGCDAIIQGMEGFAVGDKGRPSAILAQPLGDVGEPQPVGI